MQREFEGFHFRPLQLSTALRIWRAWLSGDLGVLQIDVWQKMPSRPVLSLSGQRMMPHACPVASRTVQFFEAAYAIATSISLFGCLRLATRS
jgi:hypothetical protein